MKILLNLIIKLLILNGIFSLFFVFFGFHISLTVFLILLVLNARSYLLFNQQLHKHIDQKKLPKTRPLPVFETLQNQLGTSFSDINIHTYGQTFGQCLITQLPYQKLNIFLNENLLIKLTAQELKTLTTLIACQKKREIPIRMTVAYIALKPLFSIITSIDFVIRFFTGAKQVHRSKRSFPFTYFLSPLLKVMIQLFASPKLLLEADREASNIIGNKHTLTRTLQKIYDHQSQEASDIPIQYFQFFLIEPLTKISLYRNLYWHVSLKARTKKLIGHYPA